MGQVLDTKATGKHLKIMYGVIANHGSAGFAARYADARIQDITAAPIQELRVSNVILPTPH